MGKRRIRNLKHLKADEIFGFDVNSNRCKEVEEKYKIKTFTDFDEGLKKNPDAMIISTPPDLHMKYAKIALENNIHFFTEASVTQDGMQVVINGLKQKQIIGFPSCTLRFHPIILKIKEIIDSKKLGKVLSFTYHSGQYLPDWHPWEDYRNYYVSKRETGACREIVPFEINWLISIFGKINSLIGIKDKISDLDADIDDIYEIILDFENKIKGVLIVDVISRVPIRDIKIFTENGVIFVDWYKKSIDLFVDKKWEHLEIDPGEPEKEYLHGEKPYIDEMNNFIMLIKEKTSQEFTYENDLEVLKILDAIESSSIDGTRKIIK